MDVLDNLKVKVIEADGLSLVNGMPPTAYVEIVVGQERMRTREVDSTTKPHWNEQPMIFERILGESVNTLLAFIYHKDEFSETHPSLGVAIIPMDTFYNCPNVEIDYWFDVSTTPDMLEVGEMIGRIRLQILYTNVVDETYLDTTATTESAPNLLQINVVSATGLQIKSPIEALIEIQVGTQKKQTKVSKKSLAPAWNEDIELPVFDGNEFIGVTLKQYSILRNVFIGRVRITMNEVAAAGDKGMTKTYTLLNENFEFSEVNRGELQLQLKWVFDQRTYEVNRRRMAFVKKKGGGGIFSSMMSTVLGRRKGPTEAEEEERKKAEKLAASEQELIAKLGAAAYDMTPIELAQYLEEQKEKRLSEVETLVKEQRDLADEMQEQEEEIKEGDYTVQVHIIEVKDLVGLNFSGMSDPFCVIEVMGHKQRTTVAKETNTHYFNENYYFNLKDLKRDQFNEAHVKISVYDYNMFRSNELIGIYQVDLQSVYRAKDHELYRRTAYLRDPTNKDDSGTQGLLKYSVVCLGPGDTQKVHDPANEEEEEEKDMEMEEGAGKADDGDADSQALEFLVVSVIRASGMQGYNRYFDTVKHGLSAYVQFEFNGSKPLETTHVTCEGRKNISVNFDQELWIPVWVPTMCTRAALSLMNHDIFRPYDSLLATSYFDYEDVPKYEKDPIEGGGFSLFGSSKKYAGPKYQWLHFYGANPTVRGGGKDVKLMNRFPNYASAYRGSLLCSLRVVKQTSGGNEAAFVRSIDGVHIPESFLPQDALYLVRVMIYQGSDFGSKGTHASGKGPKYSLGINIGRHEVTSSYRQYEDGAVDWLQLMEVRDLVLPKDYKNLPDTFITVYRGSESSRQSVAYTRVKTSQFLPKNGVEPVAQWFELHHDLSHKNNSTIGYPGSVLLKMQVCNIEDADDISTWEADRRKLEMRAPYCLRALVYQCRDLPAVDDNGLIDPYVKVRFCGQKQKTEVRRMTQNPAYYQVLEFNRLMLPFQKRGGSGPDQGDNIIMHLAPDIVVQVWDNKLLSRVPVASFRMSVANIPPNCIFKKENQNATDLPVPQWRDLYGIDGSRKLGQILVSFQLFEKKDIKQAIPSSRLIVPTMRRAYIDLHTVGLRNLLKPGRIGIRKPYLHYEIGGGHESMTMKLITKASNQPTPFNPNYLERQYVMIDLPEDPLYAPSLEVRCFDTHLASTMSVMLGSTVIHLLDKMPWNTEDYKPPRQHELLRDNAEKRKKLQAVKKEDKPTVRVKKSAQKKNKLAGDSKESAAAAEEEVEEKEEEPTHKRDRHLDEDSGQGVFPTTVRELRMRSGQPHQRYLELPVIKDQEELDMEKAARQEEDRLNLKASADMAQLGGASSKLPWKKILGIPTNWTSADYLKGREKWIQSKTPGEGGPLEDQFKTTAFEKYTLYRGHISFNKFRKRRNTVKKVGQLKGVVRITISNPRYDKEFETFQKNIRAVQACKVRLYIIKAQNLQSVDGGWFGAPDTFLKVSLGDKTTKNLGGIVKKKNNPEYFECYEFDTKLPGPSQMNVQVMAKSLGGIRNTLIGETNIDLEDRWFHPKWTEYGDLKPLEIRTLRKETSSIAKGVLVLWVDIMTAQDALMNPKIEMSKPEQLKFEIRVVIWRTVDVKVYKQKSLDFFVTAFMNGDSYKPQTDTHFFCKTGKGSWNWRMKLPITLPLAERELGLLRLELWDRNFITSNTIIGVGSYDLYDWLLLAYRRQGIVTPFEELYDLNMKAGKGIDMDETTGSAEVDLDMMLAGTEGGDGAAEGAGGGLDEDEEAKNPMHDSDEEASKPLLDSPKTGTVVSAVAIAAPSDADKKIAKDAAGGKGGATSSGADDENKEDDDDEEEEEEEEDELLKNINEYFGWGDKLPKHASWIPLSLHDRSKGSNKVEGKLAISIHIVSAADAEARPAGYGRDEPNNNPVCPPPYGRYSFKFDPLSLLTGLCGPRMVCLLICICCCCCCMAAFMFISVYLSGIESVITLFNDFRRF